MNLPAGTLLHGGTYKIIRQISSGGFGITYEAEHVMLRKHVAIKEFFVKGFCNRDEETSHVTVGTQSKVVLVKKLEKKVYRRGYLYQSTQPSEHRQSVRRV